ncbi:MAG: SHOCT domain-containing protein [Actinomycetota bacterium]
MSGEDDRQQRDLHLLMKSYKALEAEQQDLESESAPQERSDDTDERSASPGRRATDADPEPRSDDVVMYRGRPVRRGRSTAHGASSQKPSQFRGAGGGGKRRSSDRKPAAGADRIKQALASLAEMHEDGLITKAEYDAKRRQLLDRL